MRVGIVGGGLAGCSCARMLADKGIEVEIFEKEGHIGGLMYDKDNDDIFQHFGPHIFHTSNPNVINFVLRFARWKGFCNRPLAITDEGFARLPISIETIADLKGDKLGEEVYDFEEERGLIYDNIIKGYSKKQWGKPNEDAVKRLRVSQTIGGSYFDDVFEGLPIGGFYKFLCNMIDHENVKAVHLNKKIIQFEQPFDAIIWTAPIDEHPSCEIDLRWNGTAFLRTHSKENFLTAVYNYNVDYVPWTRRTKMKLLTGCESEDILIEIPRADDNAKHYILEMDEFEKKYIDRFMWIEGMGNSYFCGRSATAKYLDMDEVIEQAENVVENVCSRAVLSDT